MRSLCVVLGLFLLLPAFAEIPPSSGIQPSGRPVGGPIRPKNEAVVEPSDRYALHRLNFGGYAPISKTTVIFWGTRWRREAYSRDKISGLDEFYSGFDNSNYAHATDEYRLLPSVLPQKAELNYTGHIIVPMGLGMRRKSVDDFDAASLKVCQLAESGKIKVPMGVKVPFYAVYLDRHRPKGGACSMHGYYDFGSMYCPGNWRTGQHNFFIAMFYDLDGDTECGVEDYVTGHSQGLAALANQSASAIADVRTDGAFDSLYDSEGNEVGDKCSWVFQVPFVTFTNGSIWKLQSLWSNAAYRWRTGYPNQDGARGCVNGDESRP